jgi:murein DD-endopeptidase MepM/ murein hydrolase activator NlpD
MKSKFKFYSLVLVLAIFISCLPVNAETLQLSERSNDVKTKENAICCSDNGDKLNELIELGQKSESVEEVFEKTKNYNRNKNNDVKINDVKIYNNVSDFEKGIQASEGEINDNMVVRIEYGDDSWIEYLIFLEENKTITEPTRSPSTANFVYPLDRMNTVNYYSNSSGHITQEHGGSHRGIDIAWGAYTNPSVSDINGTFVRAVSAGAVTHSGFDNNYGFGNHVAIKHTANLSTAYAHLLSTPLVSVSSNENIHNVSQGQLIGRVGNTGASDGPHLHFEVLTGKFSYAANRPHVNPRPYLEQAHPYTLSGLYYIQSTLGENGYDDRVTRYIHLKNGSTASETPLVLHSDKNDNAKFYFFNEGNGYYSIMPYRADNKYVEVRSLDNATFRDIWLWGWNGGANQLWKIEKQPDGTYVFINKNSIDKNDLKVIDIIGNNNTNQAPIKLYDLIPSPAQKFRLLPA